MRNRWFHYGSISFRDSISDRYRLFLRPEVKNGPQAIVLYRSYFWVERGESELEGVWIKYFFDDQVRHILVNFEEIPHPDRYRSMSWNHGK